MAPCTLSSPFCGAHTFLLPVSKSTSGTCPLPRAQAPPQPWWCRLPRPLLLTAAVSGGFQPLCPATSAHRPDPSPTGNADHGHMLLDLNVIVPRPGQLGPDETGVSVRQEEACPGSVAGEIQRGRTPPQAASGHGQKALQGLPALPPAPARAPSSGARGSQTRVLGAPPPNSKCPLP